MIINLKPFPHRFRSFSFRRNAAYFFLAFVCTIRYLQKENKAPKDCAVLFHFLYVISFIELWQVKQDNFGSLVLTHIPEKWTRSIRRFVVVVSVLVENIEPGKRIEWFQPLND